MQLSYNRYTFGPKIDGERYPSQVNNLFVHLEADETLPDAFFTPYSNLSSVTIYAEAHVDLPSSLFDCKWLRTIELKTESQHSIPKAASKADYLEYIGFDTQSHLICADLFLILNKNRNFTRFTWCDFGDAHFSKEISEMTNLEELTIKKTVLEKVEFSTLIDTVAQMKNLKTLCLDLPKDFDFPIDELLKLDFLDEVVADCFAYSIHKNIPLSYARMKKARLVISSKHRSYLSEHEIGYYLQAIRRVEATATQRELLFGFSMNNHTQMKDLIENPFGNEARGKRVFVHSTLKKERKDDIVTNLEALNYVLAKKEQDADIHVITHKTNFDTIKKLVLENKTIALEAQLNDFLLSHQEQYLLEEDNEPLNDELLRLLSSNSEENMLLAFSIIEGGGANKVIQSVLTAIYIAHPNKTISDAVTPLFEKYVSASYRQYIGGRAAYRHHRMSPANYKKYATHKDIDKLAFLLMYNKIAGENDDVYLVSSTSIKFNEQDIKEFTAILQYFPNIEMINLRKNPNFNLEKSLPYLAMLPRLKTIKFQGNAWKVCDLSSLKSLTKFELSKQQIDTLSWVENMPSLKHIVTGQTTYGIEDFYKL
jgi:hypothetical protein